MRRNVMAAIAVLATVTSLALIGIGFAIQPPAAPNEEDKAQEAGNRATVRAFYDAINAVIATGDPSLLTSDVPPGFAAPEDAPSAGSRRDQLIRHLLAVHAADPDVRIEVASMAADGDVVIAHVWTRAIPAPTLESLRLGASWVPWAPVDVFRFAGGRMVERWGPISDPTPTEPVIRFGLDEFPEGRRELSVIRRTLAAGATHLVSADEAPRLIALLDGAVSLEPIPGTNDPAGQAGQGVRSMGVNLAEHAMPRRLAAGDHVLLQSGPDLSLHNIGETPATVLDLAFRAMPAVDSWDSHPDANPAAALIVPSVPGVTSESVADGLFVTMPGRPITIVAARVTLAPDERLWWSTVAGPVLLHVDSGQVAIDATGPVPWLQAADRDRTAARDGSASVQGTLVEGGEALLEESTGFDLGAGAPGAAITIIAILANEGGGTRQPPIAAGTETPMIAR